MVVARLIGDPDYRRLVEGAAAWKPAHRGRRRGAAGEVQDRDPRDASAHHRPGRRQRQAPDPLAAQVRDAALGGGPPASGTRAADGTLARYDWHVARIDLPGAYDRLLRTRSGRVAALFVGSDWVPRHVALIVRATATGKLQVYDPAYGRLDEVDRFAFLGRRVGIAGWDVPWIVVTPDA